MECTSCHTPLADGLDTYGPNAAPLCWTCFSTGQDLDRSIKIKDLEEELEELEDQAIEIQDNLDDVESDIRTIKRQIKELKGEVKAGDPAHVDKYVLSDLKKWVEAVKP